MHPQIKKLEPRPVSTVYSREKRVNGPLVLFLLHFKNYLQLLPCKHLKHTLFHFVSVFLGTVHHASQRLLLEANQP